MLAVILYKSKTTLLWEWLKMRWFFVFWGFRIDKMHKVLYNIKYHKKGASRYDKSRIGFLQTGH